MFRGLSSYSDAYPARAEGESVGGALFLEDSAVTLRDNRFETGEADVGTEVYLADMHEWLMRHTEFVDYDSRNTVSTLRSPLAACSEHPCPIGYNCDYKNHSLICAKCPPNLASVDGVQCRACPDGQVDMTPLQYRPFTPELRWQSRGTRRISQGRV